MSTYYYVINNKQETRSEPVYFFEWTYNGGSALFGMHGTESEYNAKMLLKGDSDTVKLVTRKRLPESVVTEGGGVVVLDVDGPCDCCFKPATRVMCKYTCKDCAEWFYGHYCNKCFDLVSADMGGVVDYENFVGPDKKTDIEIAQGVIDTFKNRFNLYGTITGRIKSP